jgi:riboflavin synthase
MFTGLVQQIGTVRETTASAGGRALRIACALPGLELGESIAIDGCCLTVTRVMADGFTADASAETLARTTLGERRAGERLHLERALRLGDRLGGHLVSGHVDGVGRMLDRSPLGDSEQVRFEVPDELARFIAPKGSIAVDGVSLTVNGVEGARFDVVLVPYTRRETTFDERPAGSRVNIEVDIVARYVARFLEAGGGGGVTLDLLARQGYL